MDDVKNQFKGLAKKFHNTFSSSSSRFTGEGHRLGNGKESSQPNSLQQADWRKLQQERWEKEHVRHTTPPQGRSNSTAAPSAQSQSSIVPNSSTRASIRSSADTSSGMHENGSSIAVLSDAATGVNINRSGMPEATNLQNGEESEIRLNPLDAFQTLNLGQASTDADKTCKRDDVNRGSHVNHVGIINSSDFANSKASVYQNESPSQFNPFSAQIGSLSSSNKMSGLQMYQCPVCANWWKSETEVSAHIDECLNKRTHFSGDIREHTATDPNDDQVKVSLGVFLSGGPSVDTIDVFLRILRNIVNSPDLEKFRKIRLNNPKIHDTVGMALGGIELLEALGFSCKTEEEEIWAIMDQPSIVQTKAMQGVISELEACVGNLSREEVNTEGKTPLKRKVDRQIRVFYAAPENLAAKMELPDSFFELSPSELRQEAAARKKKLENSQVLVSRVSRDRMAAANKRKYKAAIIRIQFPDGVVLQGMFLPWEPTTAIYEFVSTSLRDPSTQFTLIAPGLSRKEVIPALADGSSKIPTLEEENLVPAVLVKFQCADSDLTTFTGLHPDVLVAIEPLSSTTLRC